MASDYKAASQAVWQAMAAGWDARHVFLEETARPVTERMLSRLDPRPGETILDLAAGSGIAGLAAAATAGRVIVSDFSPAMVEAAHRHARELGLHNVDCRVLDAERLDLPDGSVDGVVCRWGYMLMGDPAAALAETRRVLRPSGRLACAVFAGAEENPWAGLPSRVLVEHGHMPPPEAGAPGILALADRDRLRALITGAGFADPEIEDVAFTWRFADGDEYWDFLAQAAGAIAMVLERLADDERAAVRRELDERVAPYRDGAGLEFPAVSLVASA